VRYGQLALPVPSSVAVTSSVSGAWAQGVPGPVDGGTPFFPSVSEHAPLELHKTRAFEDRVVLECYARAGRASG
jgi:hypothetical protein